MRRRGLPVAVPSPHRCPGLSLLPALGLLTVAKRYFPLLQRWGFSYHIHKCDLISIASKNRGPGWASFLRQAMASWLSQLSHLQGFQRAWVSSSS